MKKERRITTVLSIIYLVILTWIILFKMETSIANLPQIRSLNLIPFAGSAVTNDRIDFDEIINNMLVFVPVGVFVSMLAGRWPVWKKILPICAVSLCYEVLQYVFAIGASDITDLIMNTLGGAVGILVTLFLFKVFREKAYKVLTVLASVGMLAVVMLLSILFIFNRPS